METIKTLVLIGGINKNSLNHRLFNEIAKQYSGKLSFTQFAIDKLPYYLHDFENEHFPVVEEFKSLLENSHAVLLITPEYNHSFPGVLKNALDWGSRLFGKNYWSGKPVAIIRASAGKMETFAAQGHLQAVCSFLNMYVMKQPKYYEHAQTLLEETGLIEEALPFAQEYVDSFENWVEEYI